MERKPLIIIMIILTILLSGCTKGYQQVEEEWSLVENDVMTFSDGVSVDLWTRDFFGDDVYKLSDGTVLLRVQELAGPSNTYVGGNESYDDLTELAQKKVDEYYYNQRLLYDVDEELKKAYSEYLQFDKNPAKFNDHFISQEIVPITSNDKIMSFLTSVILPVEGQVVTESHFGAVFDRETGEYIDIWDIFTLEESEVRKILIDKSGVEELGLKVELENALESKYICMFDEYFEVMFPQGTLSSQDQVFIISIYYDDVQNIMQDWAMINKLN